MPKEKTTSTRKTKAKAVSEGKKKKGNPLSVRMMPLLPADPLNRS